METTMDLLSAALAETEMNIRALSLHLGHSPWTLYRARERESLSPLLAGQLAQLLDMDIEHWMAIAALESEPSSVLAGKLRHAIEMVRNSYFAHLAKVSAMCARRRKNARRDASPRISLRCS